MESKNVENWPPKLQRKDHALISGTIGKAHAATVLAYLIDQGYDNIQFEYPKDGGTGRVFETRLLVVSATKKIGQQELRVETHAAE